METTRTEVVDEANARAQVYGLLAAVFRAEPDEVFLDKLKSSRFFRVFLEMGIDLGKEFNTTPSPQLAEDLAIEYARLFIGPGPHLSPHESIYVDDEGGKGGLWGTVTVKVKKFIESAGLDYQTAFTGLPDHISVELEFMQKLASSEFENRTGGENSKADWCTGVQKKFIDEHLSRWAPEFCDQVSERTSEQFYCEMAKLAKNYLEFDRQLLAEKLNLAA